MLRRAGPARVEQPALRRRDPRRGKGLRLRHVPQSRTPLSPFISPFPPNGQTPVRPPLAVPFLFCSLNRRSLPRFLLYSVSLAVSLKNTRVHTTPHTSHNTRRITFQTHLTMASIQATSTLHAPSPRHPASCAASQSAASPIVTPNAPTYVCGRRRVFALTYR